MANNIHVNLHWLLGNAQWVIISLPISIMIYHWEKIMRVQIINQSYLFWRLDNCKWPGGHPRPIKIQPEEYLCVYDIYLKNVSMYLGIFIWFCFLVLTDCFTLVKIKAYGPLIEWSWLQLKNLLFHEYNSLIVIHFMIKYDSL